MIFNQVSKEEVNKINERLDSLPNYYSFDFAFTPDETGIKIIQLTSNVSALGLKKDKIKSVAINLIGATSVGTVTPRIMWSSSGNLNGFYADVNVVKTHTTEKTGTVHIIYTK